MKILKIEESIGQKLVGGKLPDIDSDFPGRDRPKVKDYMSRRFGEKQVVSIGTFTTLQLKGAIKDLYRTVSSDFFVANSITGRLGALDTSFKDLIRLSCSDSRLKSFIKDNSDLMYMLPTVLNQPKTTSIHACAMIIFPDVMTAEEWCPVRMQDGMVVSEWGGEEMDAAGFLKEDILGIKQLDKFSDILDMIKSAGKEIPDIYNLPHDDEVFRFFKNGWNGDVFQLGTEGLTGYCKTLRPQNIDDLIAAVALFRPGPMQNGYHEIYAKCKNDGRKVEYLWGTEDITKDTYGLLCYQEQIMKVCSELGDLTMKEADDVRRAMGKKKLDVIQSWETRIRKGFIDKGCDNETFDGIWDVMLEFARYSFNKSHAAAYAQTAYICQYLKVHFPLEYWTTALGFADQDKGTKFLSEIFQAKKIKVYSIDINGSLTDMSSDQEKMSIYWGFKSVKGVGEIAADQIIEERMTDGPYKSLDNFIERNIYKGSKVKKTATVALIAAGAFDEVEGIGENKEKRLELIKQYYEKAKVKPSKTKSEITIQDNLDKDWWWLLKQKSLTGLVLTNYKHMMYDVDQSDIITKAFIDPQDVLSPIERRRPCSFGGYVQECVIKSGKRGRYAKIKIEANYRFYNVIVWNEAFELFESQITGCESGFIFFDATVQYEAKYSKANQFTIDPEGGFISLNL